MIEIRWYVNSDYVKVLQYRYKETVGINPKTYISNQWSEWKDVEVVSGEQENE